MIPTRMNQNYFNSRVLGVSSNKLLLITSSLVPCAGLSLRPASVIDSVIPYSVFDGHFSAIVDYLGITYPNNSTVYCSLLLPTTLAIVCVNIKTRSLRTTTFVPATQPIVECRVTSIPFSELL